MGPRRVILTGFALVRAAMDVGGISAPEQGVLTVLAIMANENAQCWPPINGQAGLTGKTKLSERSVQRAVQGLRDAGHINWIDKPGRGRVYVVHPRHSGTPNEVTPATETPRQADTPATQAPTPATVAPKQPVTTKPLKASPPKDARAAAKPDPFPKPDWADAGHWLDFLANRKRKRLPNTATAHARMLIDVERFSDAEWPPGRILQHAAERGWAGIYDPRGNERNGQRSHHNGQSDGPRNPMVRAVLDAEAERAARGEIDLGDGWAHPRH